MSRLGLGTGRRRRLVAGGGGATAPAIITAGQWSLTNSPSVGGDTLSLDLNVLPGNGGSPITVFQHRTSSDGGTSYGAPQSLSGLGTGARLVTVLPGTAATMQIRAVNAVGPTDPNAGWSDAKTATPTTATAGVFSAADFSVVDLQDGATGVIVPHRTPGSFDAVALKWQARLDGSDATIFDLPFPIEPQQIRFTAAAGGHTMQLRVVDDDPVTGLPSPRAWGAAVPFTLAEVVVAANMIDYSDNIADASGVTQGTGSGQSRIGWNYAGTTNTAGTRGCKDLGEPTPNGGKWFNGYGSDLRQELNSIAEADGQHVLFTVSVRRRGLSGVASNQKFTFSGVQGYTYVAAVEVNWGTTGAPTATLTPTSTGGLSNFTHGWIVQPSAGNGWVGRLFMAWTLPTFSGTKRTLHQINNGGTSYATGQDFGDHDLRQWTVGDTAWPNPSYTTAASQSILSQMPTGSDFAVNQLQEQSTTYPSGLAGTVFPTEVAVAGGNPLRYSHPIRAQVTAGGSGYAPEGPTTVNFIGGGGTGGNLTVEVLGGVIVGAKTGTGGGLNYTSVPTPDLSSLGGTGAVIAITIGYTFGEQGLSGLTITNAGSGYTPGTYVVAAVGGAGPDMSGLVKVVVGAGGTVTNLTVIQRGIYTSAPTFDLSGLPGGTGAAMTATIATWQIARPVRWPTLSGKASWNGNAVGSGAFPVEGFVAFGQFWAASSGTHLMPDGTLRGVTPAGVWTVDPNGTITGQHELQRVGQFMGIVCSNGARRSVIGVPVFLTGDQPRPLMFNAAPFQAGSDRLGERLVCWPGDILLPATGITGVTVEYQWRKNRVPISGATAQASPRFTFGGFSVGDKIDCRVSLKMNGTTVETYTTVQRTLRAAVIDQLAGATLTYGRATAANQGYIPVGDAGVTITGGNASGHWQLVSDGGVAYLTPTVNAYATEVAALGNGALAASYALTFSNSKVLNLATNARELTMSRYTDMLKILALRSSFGGPTGALQMNVSGGAKIRMRATGDWGLQAAYNTPTNPAFVRSIYAQGGSDGLAGTRLYIVAEDPADRVQCGVMDFARTRNMEMDGIEFWASAHFDPAKASNRYIINWANADKGCYWKNTAVRGPMLLRERGRLQPITTGISVGSPVLGEGDSGNKITITNLYAADVYSVWQGPDVSLDISDFRYERTGHDMATWSHGGLGNGTGLVQRRGVYETVMETVPEAHPDFNQAVAQGTVTTPPATLTYVLDQVVMVGGRSADALSQGVFLQTIAPGAGNRYAWDVTVTKSLIANGLLRALSLSFPRNGLVEDVTIVHDARSTDATEANVIFDGTSNLGTFTFSRVAAGAYNGIGASITDATVKTVTKAQYAAAFEGSDFVGSSVEVAVGEFRPKAAGPLDLGGGVSAGAINLDGSPKWDHSNVPPRRVPNWGTPSWVDLQTTNGLWGPLPPALSDL